MDSEIITRTSRVYLRPDGIAVIANMHANRQQSLADAQENVRAIAAVAHGACVPLFVDTTLPTRLTPDASRYYIGAESARNVRAVAIVADSVLGRVVANLMIPRQNQPVPMRLFATREEALEWLRQSLPPSARAGAP